MKKQILLVICFLIISVLFLIKNINSKEKFITPPPVRLEQDEKKCTLNLKLNNKPQSLSTNCCLDRNIFKYSYIGQFEEEEKIYEKASVENDFTQSLLLTGEEYDAILDTGITTKPTTTASTAPKITESNSDSYTEGGIGFLSEATINKKNADEMKTPDECKQLCTNTVLCVAYHYKALDNSNKMEARTCGLKTTDYKINNTERWEKKYKYYVKESSKKTTTTEKPKVVQNKIKSEEGQGDNAKQATAKTSVTTTPQPTCNDGKSDSISYCTFIKSLMSAENYESNLKKLCKTKEFGGKCPVTCGCKSDAAASVTTTPQSTCNDGKSDSISYCTFIKSLIPKDAENYESNLKNLCKTTEVNGKCPVMCGCKSDAPASNAPASNAPAANAPAANAPAANAPAAAVTAAAKESAVTTAAAKESAVTTAAAKESAVTTAAAAAAAAKESGSVEPGSYDLGANNSGTDNLDSPKVTRAPRRVVKSDTPIITLTDKFPNLTPHEEELLEGEELSSELTKSKTKFIEILFEGKNNEDISLDNFDSEVIKSKFREIILKIGVVSEYELLQVSVKTGSIIFIVTLKATNKKLEKIKQEIDKKITDIELKDKNNNLKKITKTEIKKIKNLPIQDILLVNTDLNSQREQTLLLKTKIKIYYYILLILLFILSLARPNIYLLFFIVCLIFVL